MARLLRRDRPLVRPWALAGPVIVLLILAPLLRPLRAPGRPGPQERVTQEAVRAILHDKTLALDPARLLPTDPVLRAGGRTFSQDPPVFDVALAGVGWLIERGGVRADVNPNVFAYLLTFFAITLPTAIAGGLLYRTGRWFELSRAWRFGLALSCVLATGWAAYATVLLSHALATALVTAAIASVGQFTQARRPGRAVGWLLAGGFCGALGGVIEPLAGWALLGVVAAAALADAPRRWRFAGVVLAVAGAAGPLTLHAVVNRPITGDLRPPRWHVHAVAVSHATTDADEDADVPSGWFDLGRGVGRGVELTVGVHGLFSHFPVLLIGVVGSGIIVRRHWTRPVKTLAVMTVLTLAGTVVYKSVATADASDLGFAAPRLLVLAPILLLWSGAWLRRVHGVGVWIVTGVALAVSIAATLIGAASPAPAGGYTHFTVSEAVERILFPIRRGE